MLLLRSFPVYFVVLNLCEYGQRIICILDFIGVPYFQLTLDVTMLVGNSTHVGIAAYVEVLGDTMIFGRGHTAYTSVGVFSVYSTCP